MTLAGKVTPLMALAVILFGIYIYSALLKCYTENKPGKKKKELATN